MKILDERKERLKFLQQRGPLKVVYFDAEGTIDSDWARKLGVDVDNVWLVRLHTQTAEQFLDQVMRVIRDINCCICVLERGAVFLFNTEVSCCTGLSPFSPSSLFSNNL